MPGVWTWSAETDELVSDQGGTLAEIARILEAEVLSGAERLDRVVTSITATDLMSRVLAFARPGALLLTRLANAQVVATAEVADLSAVVFTGGLRPPELVITKAEALGLTTLLTGCSSEEACLLLNTAGPARR